MIRYTCKRILVKVLLVLGMVWGGVAGGQRAECLDFSDVLRLKQNGVQEEVILNLIRQDDEFAISSGQAAQLRAAGFSDSMVAMLPMYVEATPTQPSAPVVSEPLPASAAVVSENSLMVPAPITETAPVPPLYAKQGWLSVSNTDWEPYFLSVDQKAKRLFLSKTPNGGLEIESGSNVTINIRKETYKLYGDSGKDLKIKIREHETTRLSLVPFGVVGNSGLNGVVQDRDKVRTETLFANYVPPPAVVVREVPTVVVQEVPTVVVQEPPVIVVPGHPRYYHPYGPYRPYHHDGMYFRYRHR